MSPSSGNLEEINSLIFGLPRPLPSLPCSHPRRAIFFFLLCCPLKVGNLLNEKLIWETQPNARIPWMLNCTTRICSENFSCGKCYWTDN